MEGSELYLLIKKLLNNTASDEDKFRLRQWFDLKGDGDAPAWELEDPAHNEEDLRLKILNAINHARLGAEMPVKRRTTLFYKVAAVILLILSVALAANWWFKTAFGPSGELMVKNEHRQIRKIELPDSSVVFLNAGSILYYAKDFLVDRKVRLEGEAFFDVKTHKFSPFVVNAGKLSTRVLGTSFNVKAFRTDSVITITVNSGRVALANEAAQILGVLSKDQQVSYHTISHFADIKAFDSKRAIAWKDGKLDFNAMRLADITQVLERWYGVSFRFEKQKLKDCRYSAAFENSIQLEELLSMLCTINNIHFQYIKQQGIVRLW